jgi:hypothetical protein
MADRKRATGGGEREGMMCDVLIFGARTLGMIAIHHKEESIVTVLDVRRVEERMSDDGQTANVC